jgi:YVTN family beta-propeller protein
MNRSLNSKRLIHIFLAAAVSIVILPAAWGATLVVANKAEATASLIELEDGKVFATIPTGEGPHEVGISPNGHFALVSNYGRRGSTGHSLTLIDITSARAMKTIDLGEFRAPHGVEWLNNEQAAVTVEGNRALVVVDVNEGTVVKSIDTDQNVSHMVSVDVGGKRAYTANMGSGSITAIDLETGTRIRNVPTGKGAEGITVSMPNGHIWVTNRDDDSLTVLDSQSFATVKEIPSHGFPIRATATPRGQVLVTRARSGELVIYDATSFDEIRTVSFDINSMGADGRLFGDRFGDSSVPIGVVTDEKGEHAYVAHANADVITQVDLATGEIVRFLRAGKEPDGMGYSEFDWKP